MSRSKENNGPSLKKNVQQRSFLNLNKLRIDFRFVWFMGNCQLLRDKWVFE